MELHSALLLQLYRSAREMSVAEFPAFAICLLKSALPFDAHHSSPKSLDAGSVHTTHVHNGSNDTGFPLEADHRRDAAVLLKLTMPHLLEALSINGTLGSGNSAGSRERPGLAIAGMDGVIHCAGTGFVELLQTEWTGSFDARLPDAVHRWTQLVGSTEFRGRWISISLQSVGDFLFLRARSLTRFACLSIREQHVAALYGTGHSHKQIARDLLIAPVTARNHLQRIYAKLGISDKAQLAVLIAREGIQKPQPTKNDRPATGKFRRHDRTFVRWAGEPSPV